MKPFYKNEHSLVVFAILFMLAFFFTMFLHDFLVSVLALFICILYMAFSGDIVDFFEKYEDDEDE